MDERLMKEIFSEKQEVPEELKKRIHEKLLKQERAIMIRNIIFSLAVVTVISMFVISFVIVFFGDILSLAFTAASVLVTMLMAAALAIAAGRYEIINLRKGL